MNLSRKLAEGTAAWLQYEFFCHRTKLFSERYMTVPIANILSVNFAAEVHTEYLHPVLAPATKGRGRRPEVDFAVIENYPAIKCVVESKWVGPGGLTAEDVLWDLLRLELIASQSGADAYFLLAGRKKHIERFFQSRAFMGEEKDGTYRRLLKLDARRNARIRVDSPPNDRRDIFRRLFEKYQEVSFCSRVTTSVCHSYPIDCPMFQYAVYVWQVISPAGPPRFYPKDHEFYRANDAQ